MKRRKAIRRIAVAGAASAAAVAALAGCDVGYQPYGGTVANADVVGTWTSNCGASMVLSAGGDATTRGFPTAWDDSGNPTKSFTGPGKWWLAAPSSPQGLNVTFNNYTQTLSYASVHGQVGFAYDETYGPSQDDEWCIFSKA